MTIGEKQLAGLAQLVNAGLSNIDTAQLIRQRQWADNHRAYWEHGGERFTVAITAGWTEAVYPAPPEHPQPPQPRVNRAKFDFILEKAGAIMNEAGSVGTKVAIERAAELWDQALELATEYPPEEKA